MIISWQYIFHTTLTTFNLLVLLITEAPEIQSLPVTQESCFLKPGCCLVALCVQTPPEGDTGSGAWASVYYTSF